MKRTISTLVFFCTLTFYASAQVDINKSISLTGAGTNAKVAGIKDVSLPNDAVNASTLQGGSLIYGGTSTFTSNTYNVSIVPATLALSGYSAGLVINFRANAANTGAASLKVGSLTAVLIKKTDGTDLTGGEITAGQMVSAMFDGVFFQLTTYRNNTGSVTSVGLSLPSIFTVTNSPVTTSGTLTGTLASQTANQVFAAPNGSSGSPGFRALVATDIPNLDAAKITTGTIGVARGGTGTGTAFTPGSVVFAGAAGVYAQNNADFFWDNTNNRLGIGNSAPIRELDVTGGARITGVMQEVSSGMKVYRNLASVNTSNNTTVGAFVVETNVATAGNTMVRVKVDGYFYDASSPFSCEIGGYFRAANDFPNKGYINVGSKNLPVRFGTNAAGKGVIIIGDETATYPYPKLHVTYAILGHSSLTDALGEGWTMIHTASLAAYSNIVTVPDVTNTKNGGGWTNDGTSVRLTTTSDFVGIGITVPEFKLDVRGATVNARIGTLQLGAWPASTGYMYVGHDNLDHSVSGNYALLQASDGTTYLNRAAGKGLYFREDNSTHMFIATGGNVGIGTGNSAAADKLEVIGNVRLTQSSASSNGSLVYENGAAGTALKDWRLVYRDEFQGSTNGWDAAAGIINRSQVMPGNYMLNNCCSNTGSHRNSIFRKMFDLTDIPHTYVKIKFTYCFIDSWDGGNEAGSLSAHTIDGVGYTVWSKNYDMDNANGITSNFFGGSYEDQCSDEEGTFYHTSNSLWLRFGSNLDDNPDDESFAVDNVEVWVR